MDSEWQEVDIIGDFEPKPKRLDVWRQMAADNVPRREQGACLRSPPTPINRRYRGGGKKIAFVTHELFAGGAERHTVTLAIELARRGFKVRVCNTGGEWSPFVADLLRAGVEYSRVLHTADCCAVIWWSDALGDAELLPNVRSIYVVHSSGDPTYEAVRRNRHRIDYCAAVSGPAGYMAAQALGDSDRTVVIWNGVNPDPFDYSAPRAPSNSFVVGYLGRYAPEKNLAEAVAALRHLPDFVRLRLYGWGQAVHDLREMAIELCVQDRVDVGGAVSDIARAYSEFDAFLLPSVFEGFPVVLSEVALAGVPVITTPNGDLPTVFGGGRGVIVQPNAFSIAAGIMRLVDSPLRRWEMAEATQAYAHKFLTDQYMGRCYAALINEVTS